MLSSSAPVWLVCGHIPPDPWMWLSVSGVCVCEDLDEEGVLKSLPLRDRETGGWLTVSSERTCWLYDSPAYLQLSTMGSASDGQTCCVSRLAAFWGAGGGEFLGNLEYIPSGSHLSAADTKMNFLFWLFPLVFHLPDWLISPSFHYNSNTSASKIFKVPL